MTSAILTVCRKEVLENSRDRRTLLSTLFFGPLFGPAMFAFLITVMVSQTLSNVEETISLPIIGQSYAPNLVAFLTRQGVEPSDDVQTLDDAVAAVRDGTHEIVVVIDPEFPERFRAGGDARVTVVFDQSQSRTGVKIRRVQALLNGYAGQIRLMRLQARGISPLVLRPFTVEEYDVSTATGRSVVLLGVLTYFLLFATLMGGMYLAIDTTAGERERGSLESLLTAPVTRADLLLGKMAATICYMLLSLILTTLAFTIALHFVPLTSSACAPILDRSSLSR